jgi:hypothetical protein
LGKAGKCGEKHQNGKYFIHRQNMADDRNKEKGKIR